MLHAYEVNPSGKHILYNNDTERSGRKVPRLALSKDVKTLLPSNLTPNKISLVLPSDQISQLPSRPEIKDLYLSPHNRESGMGGWDPYCPQEVGLTEYRRSEKPPFFDSTYPAIVPTAYRCSNMAAMPVDSFSSGNSPRRFLLNVQNHPRADRPRYHRLRPNPLYPLPLQSAVSPLKPSHSSPPPTRPSPTLPLHQPRPSKRIPIISLSRLALACEDLEETISNRSRNEITSSNLDFSEVGLPPDSAYNHKRAAAESRDSDRLRHVLRCSCGCMESYAIG